MKCLFLIDVQNGFIDSYVTRRRLSKIFDLLKNDFYDYVFASQFVNTVNSPYRKLQGWDKMIEDKDYAICQDILPFIDKVFVKNGNSSCSDELLQAIKDFSIDEVHLVGFNTECCVLVTANDLFENNVSCYVLSKFCASLGGIFNHYLGIKTIKRIIGKDRVV